MSARLQFVFGAAAALLTLGSVYVAGQATTGATPGAVPIRQYESREQLELKAQQAEAKHRTEEAFILRTRLKRGDFQEGDRIVVERQNVSAGKDTTIVRAGKVLQFPGMDDMQLEGILRSELDAKLSAHLAKYLRDPAVRATPLLRIALTGQIARQGFYYPSADLILPDLIMLGGGPIGTADLNKITIRRGTEVIWNPTDTQTALADGLSLDRLHLRAGDEVEIGERTKRNWQQIVSIITASLALVLAVLNVSRR